MTTINAKWIADITHGNEQISLDDLGLCQEDWDDLSDWEKQIEIQDHINNLPRRIKLILTTFEEEDYDF